MTDDERDSMIVETHTTTKLMHKELFGNGQPGRLPQLEKSQAKQGEQIAFWRGAIWIIGGLLTLIGGALLEHIHVH